MRLIDVDNLKFSNGMNIDGLVYVPLREIKKQPTAYNVDHIMTQLIEESDLMYDDVDSSSYVWLGSAINIVKEGGKVSGVDGTGIICIHGEKE